MRDVCGGSYAGDSTRSSCAQSSLDRLCYPSDKVSGERRALSVLFTNNTLAWRAGSELWVRDVCRSLVLRGHHPIAFSLVMGAVAEDLRAATVPVVTDLDQVSFTPDVIHGQHHLETLIAALHFPAVPIVHVCHGWAPWEEQPLKHPSIARYIAVDETCLDRLTTESGIPRNCVELLLNFVDLARFTRRAPLPERPRTALVFSHRADEHGYVTVIREACRQAGIEVEVAGARAGRIIERPEELLPRFDLVFARARTALEALAVGCSVVLADECGAGPLVTERDFDRMRALNFGIRFLQRPHSVDWYRAQIGRYGAAEAGRITTRVRETAGLEPAVDRLVDIYEAVVARRERDSSCGHAFSIDSQRAAARHLSSVALRFKSADGLRQQLADQHDALLQEQAARSAAHEAVTAYQALATIRLRNKVIGIPLVGEFAKRFARSISRSRLLRH